MQVRDLNKWKNLSLRPYLQRIRIYPGRLEFSLDKISSDSKRLQCKGTKHNDTLATFVVSGNVSRLPCLHEWKYGAYPDLFNYAVNLPG